MPDTRDVSTLAAAASGCQGCEQVADANRTVVGRGTAAARVMLVGEQPGDSEDREGEPFVGPAGRLLDGAPAEAGIDRGGLRDQRGEALPLHHHRRAAAVARHPGNRHVTACRPWLEAELAAVRPRYVAALGATAAKSLLGPAFRVTKERGRLIDWPPEVGPFAGSPPAVGSALATIHPSEVLRARTAEDRETSRAMLVADLAVVGRAAG